MTKTVLITGASSGIGYELAKIFASHSFNLVLIARSFEKLSQIKADFEIKYSNHVYIISKDLSLRNSVPEIFTDLQEKNISIDILVNNAGFGDFGFFENTKWEKEERMINLNISALVHLTKLLLPQMIERKEGKILNVASTASFLPGPNMSVYFATKAFVLSFSEALSAEVKKHHISVTTLCPGPTESNFAVAADIVDSNLFDKKNKIPSSEEVALFGYNALMKNKGVVIHGFMNTFMTAAIRFTPRKLVILVAMMKTKKKN